MKQHKIYGKEIVIWDGVLTKPVFKQYKISLCTTCMGRLHDLRRTLPKNIFDNADYPNVEFVILDYNSKDDLGKWVKDEMMGHIKTGKLVYARTDEPTHYSMGHSRNVAFKLASGDIVNNVDADNWTLGFAIYLNRLANECPEKAVFAKGRRLLHGRIGFYKDEWLALGGYDEEFDGYGHDDKDLLFRAWLMGYKLMWYGGTYVERLRTPNKHKIDNMATKDWRHTEKVNKEISDRKILLGQYIANQGKEWGKARLVVNFEKEIIL